MSLQWADCCVPAGCSCLQVDQLHGEVARYQARLAELENDFLSLDVVANTEVRTQQALARAAAVHSRHTSHSTAVSRLHMHGHMVSCEVLTEAIDIPHWTCVTLAGCMTAGR